MSQKDTQPLSISYVPQYGEVFLCDSHINGVESIHGFKGKKILNVSCGGRKTFIFEDSSESQNIVSALHDPSDDILDFNGKETAPIEQLIADFEVEQKIVEITNGKAHNVILTQSGKLYSFGFGEFGTLGHGGSIFQERPRIIRKMEPRVVVSVACGLYHTLALTNVRNVYAWGRGFQGQLGILPKIECSSSPLLVPTYLRKGKDGLEKVQGCKIDSIACGSYHSLAVSSEGDLYGWGESRYGQTGHGKTIKVTIPTEVKIELNGQKQKANMAAGGFGHSLVLTTDGDIFSWGIDVKGQLGLGETFRKSAYNKGSLMEPTQIEWDFSGANLPKFKYISCGSHRSFAIDIDGNAWSWGQGNIGFKDSKLERSPRKIIESTEDRKFDYIKANEESFVMFASIRTTSFKPNMTPSTGNTQLTFFGTGFIHTGSQIAKFSIGSQQILVSMEYDGETSTFYCLTPNFQEGLNKFPARATISISLDGQNFISFSQKLFIYPAELATHSITPKCASIQGGSKIHLGVEISPQILEAINHITIGFKQINSQTKVAEGEEHIEESKRNKSWICVEGTFQHGQVVCHAPKMVSYKEEFPFYHVDISLNGQQFTGMPSTFRFYDIRNITLSQVEGLPEGGYDIVISADGLFSSSDLMLKLEAHANLPDGKIDLTREIQSFKYDKTTKKITLKMPPITWLIGDRSATPQLLTAIKQNPIKIMLTFSGLEWVEAGQFKFVDPPPPPPEPEEEKKDSKKDGKKAAKK